MENEGTKDCNNSTVLKTFFLFKFGITNKRNGTITFKSTICSNWTRPIFGPGDDEKFLGLYVFFFLV